MITPEVGSRYRLEGPGGNVDLVEVIEATKRRYWRIRVREVRGDTACGPQWAVHEAEWREKARAVES